MDVLHQSITLTHELQQNEQHRHSLAASNISGEHNGAVVYQPSFSTIKETINDAEKRTGA